MARIRTIKPEFWTSEQVAEVSPTARLMFIGLWNFCDDNGIHPAAPRRIKMQIFPADAFTDVDVSGWLKELIDARLLSLYVVDGKEFVIVTGWYHQRIDKPTSKYPKPPDFQERSKSDTGEVPETSPTERKRNGNGNGTECNGNGNGAVTGTGTVRSSDVRGDGDQKDSIDWDEAKRDANKALATLGVTAKKKNDRSVLIKAAALKQQLGEHWFWDAIEGATRVDPKPENPFAYLNGIWQIKCGELKPRKVFNHMLSAIDVPAEILNPPRSP